MISALSCPKGQKRLCFVKAPNSQRVSGSSASEMLAGEEVPVGFSFLQASVIR